MMVLILKIAHDVHGSAAALVTTFIQHNYHDENDENDKNDENDENYENNENDEDITSAPVTTIGQITRRALVTAPKYS